MRFKKEGEQQRNISQIFVQLSTPCLPLKIYHLSYFTYRQSKFYVLFPRIQEEKPGKLWERWYFMKKSELNDKNKAMYEQLWLRYFNDSLLAQGIITKEEHQKMNTRIVNRKGRVTPSPNL